MLKYTLKRLLYLIPVVIGATLIVFLLLQLSAGDPARILLGTEATPETVESLREEMGLNDPILVQYGRYMINLLKGDMGISYNIIMFGVDTLLNFRVPRPFLRPAHYITFS